jgi:hypothetical protein
MCEHLGLHISIKDWVAMWALDAMYYVCLCLTAQRIELVTCEGPGCLSGCHLRADARKLHERHK